MSDLFDKLVDSAGQMISEVDKGKQIQTAIGGIRQRLADADRKRKIGQIKQRIRDLHAEEAQGINALSAQVWALYEAGSLTQPELVSLCRNVDEIRRKIREEEAELAQLIPAQPEPSTARRCPTCNAPVVEGATFCQSCGTRLTQPEAPAPAPVHFCVHCGAELRPGARFCPQCGQSLP